MTEHTGRTLYAYACQTPTVYRLLEKSFHVLARHKQANTFSTRKALKLLQRNVRDAARLYVQTHGLDLNWPTVFSPYERNVCALLYLEMFNTWYAGAPERKCVDAPAC